MNIVSPSILSADFADLARDIDRVKAAPWLHVDVMDGIFVPNISVGLPVVEAVRRVSDRFLDVHLMISDPLSYVERFAKAGADLVCFHTEACTEVQNAVARVRSCGKKVGVAVKPATAAQSIEAYLPLVDMVLVMTVEPGFGGQAFMADMLPKIRTIKAMAEKSNPSLLIEVDGGINQSTARMCREAGAGVFVAGSYIFGAEDPGGAIRLLQSA